MASLATRLLTIVNKIVRMVIQEMGKVYVV